MVQQYFHICCKRDEFVACGNAVLVPSRGFVNWIKITIVPKNLVLLPTSHQELKRRYHFSSTSIAKKKGYLKIWREDVRPQNLFS